MEQDGPVVIESAGILLHRRSAGRTEIVIAHMGGPFWARKENGAWTLPKGLVERDESPLAAARREFAEELGIEPPEGPYDELGSWMTTASKRVTVFVTDGSGIRLDAPTFGTFAMEWPPRSGRTQEFPEVDRVAWVPLDVARERLVAGQRPIVDEVERRFGA